MHIRKIKKYRVNSKTKNFGKKIKQGWIRLAKKKNKYIRIWIDTIPSFKFNYSNNLEIHLLYTRNVEKRLFGKHNFNN